MRDVDLEQAGSRFRLIRAFIMLHPGGDEDRRALERLRSLLAEAREVLEDGECAQRIGEIESYAMALFSDSEHRRWDCGMVCGADVLRLRILRELDALSNRVSAIGATR